jgi:molybdopterin synthase catalytic subunit
MNWDLINSTYVRPAITLYNQGKSQEAIDLLKEGYKKEHDGLIALWLGIVHKSMAIQFYEIAEQQFPYEKYKKIAREALNQLKDIRTEKNINPSIQINIAHLGDNLTSIKDSVVNRSTIR